MASSSKRMPPFLLEELFIDHRFFVVNLFFFLRIDLGFVELSESVSVPEITTLLDRCDLLDPLLPPSFLSLDP